MIHSVMAHSERVVSAHASHGVSLMMHGTDPKTYELVTCNHRNITFAGAAEAGCGDKLSAVLLGFASHWLPERDTTVARLPLAHRASQYRCQPSIASHGRVIEDRRLLASVSSSTVPWRTIGAQKRLPHGYVEAVPENGNGSTHTDCDPPASAAKCACVDLSFYCKLRTGLRRFAHVLCLFTPLCLLRVLRCGLIPGFS